MLTDSEDWNDLPPLEKARQLSEAADGAVRDGREQVAVAYYTQSLNLYRGHGERRNVARILVRLGYLAGWADFGDGLDMFTRKRALGDEALALFRELGDQEGIASALCMVAAVMPKPEAEAMLEESLALSRTSGSKSGEAHALARLGIRAALSRNRKDARALQENALRLYREIGDKASIASTLFSLSIHAPQRKKAAYLKEALTLQRELGNKRRVAEILMMLAGFAREETSLAEQEALNLQALAVCREIDSPSWAATCLDRLAEIARAQGDEVRASALEEESRSIYQPPEMDPAAQEALDKAIGSGDVQALGEAMKRAFQPPPDQKGG